MNHELKRISSNELPKLLYGGGDMVSVIHTICDRINILEQIVERFINERDNICDEVRLRDTKS